MKSILDDWIVRLESERLRCFIPGRIGIRKMIPRHFFHDYPEIFLQTKGETVFRFPGDSVTLAPWQMLIVPPELPHAEEVRKIDGEFENLVITAASDSVRCHLSRDSGEGIPTIAHYEVFEGGEHVALRQFADLMVEKSILPDHYGEIVSRGLSLSLLATVRELLEGRAVRETGHPIVKDVKNLVLSRYHDSNLKVAQLAGILNCTADYLSWLFHRETGITLNRYINQLRLKQSADLLLNTDYSVSEVAWNCGYGSPAYFSRLFTKAFGCAPVKFRRTR